MKFIPLPKRHIFKIPVNAVTKTTRLFNFTPIQVILVWLSAAFVEVKYCTASLRNHAGVSHFGASSVAFASVVTFCNALADSFHLTLSFLFMKGAALEDIQLSFPSFFSYEQ